MPRWRNKPQAEGDYRYRAFVSYSHRDKKWGKWIHAALEAYRPPRSTNVSKQRIRPVFRDDDETCASSDLGAAITKALRSSEALVVICSPNSAVSPWVNREIEEFRSLGKTEKIFGLIVGGVPDSDTQNCFPPSFARGRLSADQQLTERVEPLAIDVRTYGRRDSLLKVAAGLLGVDYDTLKRRDRARAIRRAVLAFIGAVTVLTAYGVSLLIQTRTVNLQTSAVLSALTSRSSDDQAHGRALRYGVLSARQSLLFPVADEAEPNLIRASFFSTLPAVFTGHRASIYSVAFDALGRRLASGSQDHTIRIWNRSESGRWSPESEEIVTGNEVADAQFAENGNAVAVRSLDGDVAIWRRNGGNWTSQRPFGLRSNRTRSFDVSAEGNVAVVGQGDMLAEIWRFDGNEWRAEANLPGNGQIPTAVAVADRADRVAVGYFDGTIHIFEADGSGNWVVRTEMPQLLPVEVRRLSFAASGERLLAISIGDLRVVSQGEAGAWNAQGKIDVDKNITSAAFLSPEGELLVTNATSGSARLWREDAGGSWQEVSKFGDDMDITRSIAASADGGAFATGGNNNATVRIWEPGGFGSWRSYAKVRGFGLVTGVDNWVDAHTGFTESRIWSNNRRRVARNDVYGIVRIYDTTTEIEVAAMDVSSQPRYSIAFSASDEMLRVSYQAGAGVERDIPVRMLVALSGRSLIDTICSERMSGAISILTEADVKAAPVLRGRAGEDVCGPPALLERLDISALLPFRYP